jgi:hypothetical protein
MAVVFVPPVMVENEDAPPPPEQVPGKNCDPDHTKHCPTTAPAWLICAGEIIADPTLNPIGGNSIVMKFMGVFEALTYHRLV